MKKMLNNELAGRNVEGKRQLFNSLRRDFIPNIHDL